MDWLKDLVFSESAAHSIMLLSVTIALGIQLGKIKIFNISLGITWILFVGIFLSHFGFGVEVGILNFVKEFGLILFVYSIGLQVGPGFFSSLKSGGLRLNMLAVSVVLLGALTTYVIHLVTRTDLTTMVGVLSGAVTNTPGLGAAQQTYTDITGMNESDIALGYAVAYPLGVIGIILVPYLIKKICRIDVDKEQTSQMTVQKHVETIQLHILVQNQCVIGRKLSDIVKNFKSALIVSRIKRIDGTVGVADDDTVLQIGDVLRVITTKDNEDAVVMLLGKKCETKDEEWETPNHDLVSRRIVVTKPELNGVRIGSLNIRALYGVNITRINRNGIELVATRDLQLQMGDRVTLVGSEDKIRKVATLLGNSMKRLDTPNLIPIFLGIFLGVLVGSVPIAFPGLPQEVKLGLAGGPLIVAILMGRFGPYYKIVTFTTTSANMMIREIGISLFLAAVGLGAGKEFVSTLLNGGYMWVIYGLIITIVPLLAVGIFARKKYKMDYYSLCGLIAGSTTDPPALAFANSQSPTDAPSVAYATVYPLTMFLRVLTAQILIIISFA